MARTPAHPLHILFGESAAGAVIQSLRLQKVLREHRRVIVLQEPLQLGPIAPASPRRRTPWFREALISRHVGARRVDRFWRRTLAEDSPIVWASSCSARESCGLMELAWRRRRPFRLIDVATNRRLRVPQTGLVGHETMLELRLVEDARKVEQAEVDALAASWDELAREPEPMRIATAHGVLAVPLSHFDTAIIAQTPTTWTRAVVVIGALWSRGMRTGYAQFDEELLAHRIDTLLDGGLLESDNMYAEELRELRIRRPS